MARPKKKPEHNSAEIANQVIEAVTDAYLNPAEGSADEQGHTHLYLLAEEFSMTPIKIRKLLITSGAYEIPMSIAVNKLYREGKTVKEIQEQMSYLANVWFGNFEHTQISKELENYILRGGVYGSAENLVAVHQAQKGGKIKYAISKIWLPYETIKFYYPVLKKHKWLLPICQVRRWFKLLFVEASSVLYGI